MINMQHSIAIFLLSAAFTASHFWNTYKINWLRKRSLSLEEDIIILQEALLTVMHTKGNLS